MYVLINQMDAVLNAMDHANTEQEKDIGISIMALIVEHHKRHLPTTAPTLAAAAYAAQGACNQSTREPPHLIA